MPLTIELLLLTAVLGRVVMLVQRPTQPVPDPLRAGRRCGKRPAA
jgi:hypothetical protein